VPRQSVYFIRAALIQLGLGFTMGALMLANKGISFEPMLWRLLFPHVEVVLFGWTLQLVMGVALWILPRISGARKYGNERLGWSAFVLLNGGVLAVALGYWFGEGAALLAAGGRVAELLAAVLFALQVWSRIKPIAGAAATESKVTSGK
jgi:heme/copper-type cytochrome/quinol oxidase subunit 1